MLSTSYMLDRPFLCDLTFLPFTKEPSNTQHANTQQPRDLCRPCTTCCLRACAGTSPPEKTHCCPQSNTARRGGTTNRIPIQPKGYGKQTEEDSNQRPKESTIQADPELTGDNRMKTKGKKKGKPSREGHWRAELRLSLCFEQLFGAFGLWDMISV